MMTSSPPVLIVAFNRPDETRQLVEVLGKVRPFRIYAAVDGPRDHVPADAARVDEVRSILSSIPWEHELQTRFLDANLGCGPAVSSAITWFFEHEPEGIILEDDVLPHPSMFGFMGELLERYRDDKRVMHISGSNYAAVGAPEGYFFSRYVAIWGWASWRRAWEHFALDISDWREQPDVLHKPGLSWRTRKYLAFSFDRAVAGLGNWDYQWKYAVMRHGLAITPNTNLSVTTGFGEDATGLRSTGRIPPLEQAPPVGAEPAAVDVAPALEQAMFHEQLSRGAIYWEASRWLVPSPHLYHEIGKVLRGIKRRVRRS